MTRLFLKRIVVLTEHEMLALKSFMKTIQTLTIVCILGCQLQAQVSFKLSSSPSVGSSPRSVAVADINGDDKMDLICANYYGNSLSALTNNGNGGFVLSGTYPVGNGPN